jgi:hypothetical protein
MEASPVPDASNDVAEVDEISTADAAIEANEPMCQACSSYGEVKALGLIPPKLPELSGLAASVRHPGTLYAHNDSGDMARFFALSQAAEIAAEMDLTGATATDWEDIAVGPCPGGSCVYAGDIGDNNLVRAEYVIYRVAEPDELPENGAAITVTYERFPFVYPDGRHNAETLLVHPSTGRVFVLTKVGGAPSTVYEMPLPLAPDQTVTLTQVTTLSLPATAGVVTGGDFHPCGDRLLLRTYGAVYELSASAADAPLESLFKVQPVQVPAAVEPKGEAITYAADGRSYFTASETVTGAAAVSLNVVACL